MIDPDCHVLKQRQGFCWCPTRAWGENMTDEELCKLCMLKFMICRFCGANGNAGENCPIDCGEPAPPVPEKIVPFRKQRVG